MWGKTLNSQRTFKILLQNRTRLWLKTGQKCGQTFIPKAPAHLFKIVWNMFGSWRRLLKAWLWEHEAAYALWPEWLQVSSSFLPFELWWHIPPSSRVFFLSLLTDKTTAMKLESWATMHLFHLLCARKCLCLGRSIHSSKSWRHTPVIQSVRVRLEYLRPRSPYKPSSRVNFTSWSSWVPHSSDTGRVYQFPYH